KIGLITPRLKCLLKWFNFSKSSTLPPMITTQFIIAIVAGLGLGAALGFLAHKIFRKQLIKRAQVEAQEILQEAKDFLEIRQLEEKEKLQEIETQIWTRAEPDLLKSEERIEELQEIAEE